MERLLSRTISKTSRHSAPEAKTVLKWKNIFKFRCLKEEIHKEWIRNGSSISNKSSYKKHCLKDKTFDSKLKFNFQIKAAKRNAHSSNLLRRQPIPLAITTCPRDMKMPCPPTHRLTNI